ncbi:gamma-soluble nsf attachment protein [Cystoisospora suis]|uniref:Gamma-soluble NSF attachment protein n=1 Tax=Cystoisospora suis TaxID=483139 RepID=A0A2C6L182_9APIC|nr:gamma-soluble nsf attachment protein [Cystoisospora suis]
MSGSWSSSYRSGSGGGRGRSKLAEGLEHQQRAEKAMKTSFISLKFSPDYDIAALEYKAAAECFEADPSEEATEKALHCWNKVVEIRDKQQDCFGAARALEQMATLLTNRRENFKGEKGDSPQSRICLVQREAAGRYRLAGKSDPAVRILQRAAVMKEEGEGDIRGAVEILEECISIYEEEEKWPYASEVYRDLIGLLARHGLYTPELLKALDGHMRILAKTGQQNGIFKAVMSKVVVCLTIGDLVAAENSLSSDVAFSNNFLGSREFQLAADAVDAYKSGDQDALGSVLKDQMWQFLPVEIVRLTRALKPQQAFGSAGACDPTLSRSGKESGGGGDAFDVDQAASAESWNEKGCITPGNTSKSSSPGHGYTCHSTKDSLRRDGDRPDANVSIDELLC